MTAEPIDVAMTGAEPRTDVVPAATDAAVG